MFGSFEVRRGYHHGDGGIVRLVNTCGAGIALEMLLTGEPIDAQRALQCNLVSKVVPHERLMEEAELVARQILRNSQIAVRSAKETILDVIGRPLDEQLRIEALNAYASADPEETLGAAAALLRQDRRGPRGRRTRRRWTLVKAVVTGAARGIGAAIAAALRRARHGGRDDRPRRGLRPPARRRPRPAAGPRRRRRLRLERRDHEHDRARAPHDAPSSGSATST